MKCPNCKGAIPGNYKGQTCPSCGEPLPKRRHILIEWADRAYAFSEERGFFFWLLVFCLFLALVAALEHLFGGGQLLRLLDQHKFISILMLVYTAALLKIVRFINSVVRPGYPGPYWIDRLIIKKFRRGTSLMLILGFITSLIIVGPFNIFELLPAYVLIISLFLALFWSIQSFRIDDREFGDAKVLSYFEYLGVRKLRVWRQVSGVYFIGIILSAAIFYGLSQIHGLWWMIKQNPTLNELIDVFNGLFSWVPQIMPNK